MDPNESGSGSASLALVLKLISHVAQEIKCYQELLFQGGFDVLLGALEAKHQNRRKGMKSTQCMSIKSCPVLHSELL